MVYNNVLSSAFSCWLDATKTSKRQSVEYKQKSLISNASAAVNNAVDRSKKDIALLRARLMQNRDHYVVQSLI